MIKILVIDGNKEHVETLVKAFSDYGCQINYAFDGKSGLELAKQVRPNLILYDGMLEYKAWDFANEIVGEFDPIGNNPDRPYMVLLTAAASRKQKVLCEEMGFNEYATKPTTLDALASWINKAASNHSKK